MSDKWGVAGRDLPTVPNILVTGDVFFTQSDTWLGQAIRWATQGAGEAPSETNHVGVVTYGGSIDQVRIVEALSHVRSGLITELYKDDTRLQVWGNDSLTTAERMRIAKYMVSRVGTRYNYGRIVLNLIDGLLAKALRKRDVYVARRFAFKTSNVCSTLVAEAFQSVGRGFGVDADRATPDDILDFMQHDGWRRVV